MIKKRNLWCYDFETNNEKGKVPVYFWTLRNTNPKFPRYEGISIEGFVKRVFMVVKSRYNRKKKNYFYAQNGSNFDAKFILYHLSKKKDWSYYIKPLKKDVTLLKHTQARDEYESKLERVNKSYSIITEASGKILSLDLLLDKKWIHFRCSQRLFQASISKMGELLGMPKLDIKHKNRYFKTIDELKAAENGKVYEYGWRDTDILATFLDKMMEVIPFNEWKLTTASTSVYQWLLVIKPLLIKMNKIVVKKGKYYKNNKLIRLNANNLLKLTKLDSLLPIINNKKTPIKNWFRGGLTSFNNDYRFVIRNNITFWDKKSAYPSAMVNRRLPFGPIYNDDRGELKYYMIKITKTTMIKNGIPFIPVKDKKGVWEYPHILRPGAIFYLVGVEYERFINDYTGQWKEYVLYSQNAIDGDKLFGDYINKFYQMKEKGSKFEKLNAKLMMNSLFGKMGQNNIRDNKVFNPNLYNYLLENNMMPKHWETERVESDEFTYYYPLAIWITAYTRMNLVEAVGQRRQIWLGGDTDSIVLADGMRPLGQIGNSLGQWDAKESESNLIGCFFGKKKYFFGDEKGFYKVAFNGCRLNKDKQGYITYNNSIYNNKRIGLEVFNDLKDNKFENLQIKKFEFSDRVVLNEVIFTYQIKS